MNLFDQFKSEDNILKLAAGLGLIRYDMLVIADGSGMKIDSPSGWAAVSYEPHILPDLRLKCHYGGATGGTNNMAELMPFVHVLWSYHATCWQGATRAISPRVVLVSDSEVTVKCGRGEYARSSNLPLWAAIDWFVTAGYIFSWAHIRRNSCHVHRWADDTGRKMRCLIEQTQPK